MSHYDAQREEDNIEKYQRRVPTTVIDVYDVLAAFEVHNPATAHAVKKLLCSGTRGVKNKRQDIEEAIAALKRALVLTKD